MSKKSISVPAIQSLKEALTLIYWYKNELRSFLTQILSKPNLLSRLNWQDYKRNIVGTLIDFLAKNENLYRKDIIKLTTEVCRMRDFSHLRKLDDGLKKGKRPNAYIFH